MKRAIGGLLLLAAVIVFPGVILGIGLLLIFVGIFLFIGYLGNKNDGEDDGVVWLYKSGNADDYNHNRNGEWN